MRCSQRNQDAMTKSKGTIEERLIRSMNQAVEIAHGTLAPSRTYDLPLTVREAKVPAAPAYNSRQIIAIRSNLHLSQALFAQALNVSPGTVRSWEQGAKPPQGPSRRLLEIAARSPETILNTLMRNQSSSPDEVSVVHQPRKQSSANRQAITSRRKPDSAARRRR
jgi:putative transcriptional regulator